MVGEAIGKAFFFIPVVFGLRPNRSSRRFDATTNPTKTALMERRCILRLNSLRFQHRFRHLHGHDFATGANDIIRQ